MKKLAILMLLSMLSFNSYAQVKFEKGYFITNDDEKIACLIKNLDSRDTPQEFEYQANVNAEIQKLKVEDVKEFVIYNYASYQRFIVDIDRSSEVTTNLSSKRNPVFEKETLFLENLVKGDANLYLYKAEKGLLTRFFYKKKDAQIKQLVYKKYAIFNQETGVQSIGENSAFKQELWTELTCEKITMNTIQKTTYQKKSLTNFFITYNLCSGGELEVMKKKSPVRNVFNLYLRPRVSLGSVSVNDFNNTSQGLGAGVGLQMEFMLPFYNNKWSILIEPSIQLFKTDGDIIPNRATAIDYTMNLDYTNIEAPIGLRYYMYLNKKNSFFVNALFVYNFRSLNSELRIDNNAGQFPDVLTVNSFASNNTALGLGFNLHRRLEFEMRYAFKRNLLSDYSSKGAKYTSFSFILGYRIFNKKSKP